MFFPLDKAYFVKSKNNSPRIRCDLIVEHVEYRLGLLLYIWSVRTPQSSECSLSTMIVATATRNPIELSPKLVLMTVDTTLAASTADSFQEKGFKSSSTIVPYPVPAMTPTKALTVGSGRPTQHQPGLPLPAEAMRG